MSKNGSMMSAAEEAAHKAPEFAGKTYEIAGDTAKKIGRRLHERFGVPIPRAKKKFWQKPSFYVTATITATFAAFGMILKALFSPKTKKS